MSRKMPTANTETFRVTVTVQYDNGRGYSQTYGPFATMSAAKSTVTRETKVMLNGQSGRAVTALIERAELIWQPVSS